MKKKLLAVVLSLGLTFSSVPAYAAVPTETTVPIAQYAEAILNLYSESYAYMLRSYSGDLVMAIATSPVTSEFATKDDILLNIDNINYYISFLETVNSLITTKHVKVFYEIQPTITQLITSAKLYIEGCKKICNSDTTGYSVISSALPSIYSSYNSIANYCDSINTLSMKYLSEN